MRRVAYSMLAVFICGALLLLPASQANDETIVNKFMKKTQNMANEGKAKRKRRAQTAMLDPELQRIRALQSGNVDFYKDLMPQMLRDASDDEVEGAFKMFKLLRTSPAYKAFVESGSTDATERMTAMRTGLTQISQTMLDINSLMKDKDGLNSKLQDFMEAGKSDPEMANLFTRLEGGDANAMGELQQKFANRYMGGLDLDAVNDHELLEQARSNLLNNEDMMRIIGKGNPDIIAILNDPDLKPVKSGQFAEMEQQMARLAAKYGGGNVDDV